MTNETKAAIEEAAEKYALQFKGMHAITKSTLKTIKIDYTAGAGHVIEHPERYGLTSLCLDQPWPLKDIISKLVEATDTLLIKHNYDQDYWEQIHWANQAAKKILEEQK